MNQLTLKEKLKRNRKASREWAKRFKKENPEEYKRKWKAYQEKNREKINQKLRERRKNDPEYHERILKQQREYYKRNREKCIKLVKEWNKNGSKPEARKNFYYNFLVQIGCWFEGCKIDDPEILEFHHIEKKIGRKSKLSQNIKRVPIEEIIQELKKGFPTCPTHHVLWHLCFGRKRPWRSNEEARNILKNKKLIFNI